MQCNAIAVNDRMKSEYKTIAHINSIKSNNKNTSVTIGNNNSERKNYNFE